MPLRVPARAGHSQALNYAKPHTKLIHMILPKHSDLSLQKIEQNLFMH